jgi:hypothetical protein
LDERDECRQKSGSRNDSASATATLHQFQLMQSGRN